MTADQIAYLALLVSIASASFTGWQAWTAHRQRKADDERRQPRLDLRLTRHDDKRVWTIKGAIENRSDSPLRPISFKLTEPVAVFARVTAKAGGEAADLVMQTNVADNRYTIADIEPGQKAELDGVVELLDATPLTAETKLSLTVAAKLLAQCERQIVMTVTRSVPL